MSSPSETQACCAVDPADVNVSTMKDGGVCQTATSAAATTDDQQAPSTSSGAAAGFRRRPLDGPRNSLPFLPRTSQYERHPLLQMRSTATGLSEFELLMLERDADERPTPRRMSVETSSASPSSASGSKRSGARPALVPRTTQREVHPLFVRSADSGISELEEYLKEISQMTPPARKGSAVGTGRASVSSQSAAALSSEGDGKSTATSAPAPLRRLEPRTSQCERHALLEIKDESGLSALERLFMEKVCSAG